VWTDGKRLLVLDSGNHRINIFNRPPLFSGRSADVVLGQATFRSAEANHGGLSPRSLNYPRGFSSDGQRHFGADTHNHRVLVYFSIPQSDFAAADLVLGQRDFNSAAPNRGGSPNSDTLRTPMDVFYDGSRLYVADAGNHRVLIWRGLPAFNGQAADLVIGHPSMNLGAPNDGGQAVPENPAELSHLSRISGKSLYSPHVVALHQGRLYISDTANNRVLIYERPPNSNHAHADIVLGQPDFKTGSPGGETKKLNSPRNLSFDQARMALADYANRRVLVYNSLPLTHGAEADVVLGQGDPRQAALVAAGITDPCLLASVSGVALQDRRVYACDSWNNRVLVFEARPTPTATPAPAAGR
jgi:hypothetical protein